MERGKARVQVLTKWRHEPRALSQGPPGLSAHLSLDWKGVENRSQEQTREEKQGLGTQKEEKQDVCGGEEEGTQGSSVGVGFEGVERGGNQVLPPPVLP